jgi:hypothetical protein
MEKSKVGISWEFLLLGEENNARLIGVREGGIQHKYRQKIDATNADNLDT